MFDNNSRLVVSCKHTYYLLSCEVLDNNRNQIPWPFLVTHLPVFIISPFHDVSDVQQGDTMILPTPELLDFHLFLLALDFHDVVWQGLDLCDIANVTDFADTELTLEVGTHCEDFLGFGVAVGCYKDWKLVAGHKVANFVGVESFIDFDWLVCANQWCVHGWELVLMRKLHAWIGAPSKKISAVVKG